MVGVLWPLEGPGPSAFLWQRGTFTLLPTPSGWNSLAGIINDRDQVLGSLVNDDWSQTRTVLWDHGRMTELPGWASGAEARAINNRGQIAGIRAVGDFDYHPFLWERGRMIDLLAGTGAEAGLVRGLNDDGVVVGYADGRPVVWRDGTMTYLVPPGYDGEALFVNSRGDVAGAVCRPGGEGCAPGSSWVFRWRGNAMSYIDTPSGAVGVGVVGMDERGRLYGNIIIKGNGADPLVAWIIGDQPRPTPTQPPDQQGQTPGTGVLPVTG